MVKNNEQLIAPPIGLRPKFIVDEMNVTDEYRRQEIVDAMKRYKTAGVDVPEEWIIELVDVCKRLDNDR